MYIWINQSFLTIEISKDVAVFRILLISQKSFYKLKFRSCKYIYIYIYIYISLLFFFTTIVGRLTIKQIKYWSLASHLFGHFQ